MRGTRSLLPWAGLLSVSSVESRPPPPHLLDGAIIGSAWYDPSFFYGGGEGSDNGAILLTGSFLLTERDDNEDEEAEDLVGQPSTRRACFLCVLDLNGEEGYSTVQSLFLGSDHAGLRWGGVGEGSSHCDTASVIVPVARGGVEDEGGRGGPRAILLGSSTQGGSLTDMRDKGTGFSLDYGFVADIELQGNHPSTSMGTERKYSDIMFSGNKISQTLRGGHLFNGAQYQHPVALAVPTLMPKKQISGDWGDMGNAVFYVALIASDDTDGFNRKGKTMWTEYSNLTARAYSDLIGDGTYAQVVALAYKSDEELVFDPPQEASEGGKDYPYHRTLKVLWERDYAPHQRDDGSHPGAKVAELLYVTGADEDFLVMVGTSSGYGSTFGGYGDSMVPVRKSGHDADGFITKLDPLTGEVLNSPKNANNTNWKSSMRILSQPDKDDIIHGACLDIDNKFIYVVGSTTGIMDSLMQRSNEDVQLPFVAKLSLHSLELQWKTQLTTSKGMRAAATGCSSLPDGDGVYVAGTVQNGDVIYPWRNMDLKPLSKGMDDIFLLRLDGDHGAVSWIRQLGTPHNDLLAGGQGRGLIVKKDGEAVLFGLAMGMTGGPSSKVFVSSVSPDGEVLNDISEEFSFYQAEKDNVEDPPTPKRSTRSHQIAIVVVVCSVLIAAITMFSYMRKRGDSDEILE